MLCGGPRGTNDQHGSCIKCDHSYGLAVVAEVGKMQKALPMRAQGRVREFLHVREYAAWELRIRRVNLGE